MRVLGSLEKLSLDDLLFLLRVDVEGPFLGMKHAWSHLAEAGGGVILNMSSIAGQRPISGGIAYCAAKGALTSLTRGAAAEGKPVNIRVNSIHPGMIWTEGVTDILGRQTSKSINRVCWPISPWADLAIRRMWPLLWSILPPMPPAISRAHSSMWMADNWCVETTVVTTLSA